MSNRPDCQLAALARAEFEFCRVEEIIQDDIVHPAEDRIIAQHGL